MLSREAFPMSSPEVVVVVMVVVVVLLLLLLLVCVCVFVCACVCVCLCVCLCGCVCLPHPHMLYCPMLLYVSIIHTRTLSIPPAPLSTFAFGAKIWDGCLARTYPLFQLGNECPCVLFVAGRGPDEDGEGLKVVCVCVCVCVCVSVCVYALHLIYLVLSFCGATIIVIIFMRLSFLLFLL